MKQRYVHIELKNRGIYEKVCILEVPIESVELGSNWVNIYLHDEVNTVYEIPIANIAFMRDFIKEV